MTREEARELLYNIQTDAVYNILPSEKEAIDKAIKALEQESFTIKVEFDDDRLKELVDEAAKEAGLKWIPVSEGLPKTNERVLICSDKGNVMESKLVHYVDGGFAWYLSGLCFDEVIAWMPLPMAYVESDEEE